MLRLQVVALPFLLLVLAIGASAFPDCSNGPPILTSNLVCDTTASPAERAAAVVKAMTLQEKLVNMVDMSQGAPRLGLPPYKWWNEALHGVALSPGVEFLSSGEFSHATSFANPILLAAAFDDDLVESVASVISTEARAFSNAGHAGLDFWTPNLNPYKDPRWGRGMETPGEDTFRIKQYTKHLLSGLEGPKDPYTKIIATCKHYAAYDLERWNDVVRYNFSATVRVQDLSEYYLPPFQQCARDSRVSSIMCSYNSLNAVPACANTYLMQTILRDHWNWTNEHQYITSDCNAVHNIWKDHNYAKNAADAAAFAYTAGTDTVCEAGGWTTDVTGAYNSSRLTEAVLDRALRRQFEGLIRAGYFDPADVQPYRQIGWEQVNTISSQNLARQSAADSMVLLKNNGVLPLTLKNSTSLALIGMWANGTRQMLGGYSGIPPYYNNPLYAAQKLGVKTIYANGPNAENKTDGNWTTLAIDAAQRADIVLYFGGIDLSVESEDKDRYSISWSPSQLALIQKICALGKPCVIIQLGDQLDDTPLLSNANVSAIIWAGYPGQDGGSAVFDILTGAVAPAGRLPVTQYPGDYVNQVPMTNMGLRKSGINPGRTYRFYDNAVLPFGFGLHYTDFTITTTSSGFLSKRSITAQRSYSIDDLISDCEETYLDLCKFPDVISVAIRNDGNRRSDFVALAFLAGKYGPTPYPSKTLAAYARERNIKPSESRLVKLSLTLDNLARVNERGDKVLYPGNYTILLDVPTQTSLAFNLVGKETVLDAFPQPPADEGNLALTNNTKPW